MLNPVEEAADTGLSFLVTLWGRILIDVLFMVL
jgi:hypothetical protein